MSKCEARLAQRRGAVRRVQEEVRDNARAAAARARESARAARRRTPSRARRPSRSGSRGPRARARRPRPLSRRAARVTTSGSRSPEPAHARVVLDVDARRDAARAGPLADQLEKARPPQRDVGVGVEGQLELVGGRARPAPSAGRPGSPRAAATASRGGGDREPVGAAGEGGASAGERAVAVAVGLDDRAQRGARRERVAAGAGSCARPPRGRSARPPSNASAPSGRMPGRNRRDHVGGDHGLRARRRARRRPGRPACGRGRRPRRRRAARGRGRASRRSSR